MGYSEANLNERVEALEEQVLRLEREREDLRAAGGLLGDLLIHVLECEKCRTADDKTGLCPQTRANIHLLNQYGEASLEPRCIEALGLGIMG